jgi:hypothetical protein
MRSIPILLALLALPALAACNQVYSRAPLVGEAHEGGDPELRPGLWSLSGVNESCQFDIRKRLREWPDCAVGLEIRRGQMFLVSGHNRLLAQSQRFVDGEPILLQAHWETDVLADPRAPEPKDTDNPFYGWTYYAVTPVRMDGEGHIREATVVQALCGPLPAARPTNPMPKVTDKPYAGLQVVRDNCVAKDLDAVKRSLALSATLGEPRTLKWIRDDP